VTHRLQETKPQTVGHAEKKQRQNHLDAFRACPPTRLATNWGWSDQSAGRGPKHACKV